MPQKFYITWYVFQINDSDSIDTHNIYGEKAYLTQDEWNGKDFSGYVNRVYSLKYQIEQINKEVKSN